MSNSGGKITAPVSIEDVRTVLGVSSYDLGTLCKNSNGKINKWSKYKPVRQPFVVAPNSNWYKANDGFCGLKVGWSTAGDSSLTNLVNAYKQGTWDYLPPTGGDSQPFRLLDFEGYDHNAGPFVSSKMKKGTELKVNTMASNALTLAVTYNSSPTSLQITDFGNAGVGLDRAHLAAALYNKDPLLYSDATRLQTVISDTPVDQRGTVTFNFTASDINTTRFVMLFLASTTVSNNMCIPYDDNNYFLFKVDITQEYGLNIIPDKMGGYTNGFHEITYYQANAYASNNGYADVLFFFKITNESGKTITIGSGSGVDYNLRTEFGSIYTTNLQYCDSAGNNINSNISIAAGKTWQGYFKASRMFLDFVNTWSSSTTQSRKGLYIQAYNQGYGVQKGWQNVSPYYMIMVKR